MPAPLDPAKRAAIEDDVRDGLISRNAIARKHAVSASTVSGIARALEHDPAEPDVVTAFDRSATKSATAARTADLAARRAALAVVVMGDAERLRAAMWETHTVITGKGDDAHPVEVMPTPRDLKELAIAFGVMVDKSRVLEAVDFDPSVAGKTAVVSLVDELRTRRAERESA